VIAHCRLQLGEAEAAEAAAETARALEPHSMHTLMVLARLALLKRDERRGALPQRGLLCLVCVAITRLCHAVLLFAVRVTECAWLLCHCVCLL
jgi:hypothetical protein